MTELTYDIPEGYEIASVTTTDKQIIILLDEKYERVVVKGFM